jgi:uncharacterized iron-regulated membrane protein
MKVRGNRFRQTIFWLHLACGLIAGVVIAIMSITGIAIAFEEEILDWADRDAIHVVPPESGEKLTIEAMHQRLLEQRPDFAANRVDIPSDPNLAYAFFVGRTGPIYVNPYTGALSESNREAYHDVLHSIEDWHRFLGATEGKLPIGKFITGVCNLAFLGLCLSGLYLWFPRQFGKRALKAILLLKPKAKGKARDFNWHNVLGFWSMPVLTILAATAVVISFEWGHKFVFVLAGDEPPKSRNFGMMAVEPAVVPTPKPGSQRLGYEAVLEPTLKRFPEWERIGLPLSMETTEEAALAPLKLNVYVPDYMPNRAWIPVEVDPYTGSVLQAIRLSDRSLGLQARVWVRFLHTGAAFGIVGKIIATIATAMSLVLVYSGFALSYRRFFGAKRRK